MYYSPLGLRIAVFIPCALAGTTTASLISIPTSLYYSTSSSFTTVHLPSAISLEPSSRRTISSSETSNSEILSTANPSSKSLSSSSTLHISSDFYGDSTTSISSSIVSTSTYPSETSTLSDGSSNFTPSTTTSTSSTCSATLRSTDPCPELILKDDFPPEMQDMPLTDQKLEKCREFQASLVGPNPTYDGRYGLIESPEFSNMAVHCQHLTALADNIQRRKDYIINTSLEWRFDCVQDAVAWLKKDAPYIEGLQEWLEEHKEDWLDNC